MRCCTLPTLQHDAAADAFALDQHQRKEIRVGQVPHFEHDLRATFDGGLDGLGLLVGGFAQQLGSGGQGGAVQVLDGGLLHGSRPSKKAV